MNGTSPRSDDRGVRFRRLMWSIVARPVFRFTPHALYGVRNLLLRMCGAQIGRRVRIRRSAILTRPWNLRLSDRSMIGDRSMISAVHPITIGRGSTISQGTLLLTDAIGTAAGPISIGDGCWIAADTLVLPGSRVGSGTVVGARSQVCGMLPPDSIAVGMPARAIGPRLRRKE